MGLLAATAYHTNALKISTQSQQEDDEIVGSLFAQGMAKHLLYNGCDDEENCRHADMYIDLREDD